MRADLRNTVLRYAACFGTGLAATFAFWPYRTGFIAYFVLVPFIVLCGIKEGRGRFLLASYLYGLGYFLGNLYWIALLQKEQITLPWLRLPAVIVLCAYLALFMLLTGFLARRLVLVRVPFEIALALAWGGVEFLRSLGPLGFPWASLGYSQTPYPVVTQQAALYGTYGISAWLVLVNGLLARLLLSRRARVALVAAAVFAAPIVGGSLVLSRARCPDSLEVSLVQPNIGGAVKWDEAYRDSTVKILSTMSAQAQGSAMIIWPETAVPLYLKHTPGYLDTLGAIAGRAGSPILTGYPDYERTPEGLRYYNSAMLMSPEGVVEGEYRKIHLVPFGEMIPLEERIAFLRNINFGEGDFSPGKTYEIFEVDSKRFGVAICFESIFPGLVRQFVGRGADFIVNITNDEWFGPSAAPYQHAQMAVMRCVEDRVGMARCANTGVSMLIDPYGRITRKTRIFTRGVLTDRLPLTRPGTPYSRHGYIADLTLILVPAALAALSYFVSRLESEPKTDRKRNRVESGLT